MGGSALKTPVVRISKKRHDEILAKVLPILTLHYKEAVSPPSRPLKQDFGDIDILCCVDAKAKTVDPALLFDSPEVFRNGGITSFAYREAPDLDCVQVDLIHFDGPLFGMAKLFYFYGDVGHILGIVHHSVGLRISASALSVAVDHVEGKTEFHRELHLTSDPEKFCEFLGLDHDRWLKGFQDLESLFAWITSSRYFDSALICKSTRSKDADRRPMIGMFDDWVRANFSGSEQRHSRDVVHKAAMTYFDKQEELDAVLLQFRQGVHVKKIFNGKLVAEWTGLAGKELGDLMAAVRDKHPAQEMSEMSQEQVEKICRDALAVRAGVRA